MTQAWIHPLSDEYAEYLRDESRSVGHAEQIAFPKSEAEVCEIVRRVYPTGMNLTVQGARTGLAAAAVPNGGLILNLMKLNRILGMRQDGAGRFYVTVEPGVILSQLKKRIESKKMETADWDAASRAAYIAFSAAPEQLLTPDPTESSATIGGMVACNASGARSYLYGSTRNHVSALRVVLLNGETLELHRGQTRAAGRHMTLKTEQGSALSFDLPTFTLPKTKNASGYFIADDMDAVDLFIGSDGTLGIITAIELALIPMPEIVWGVTCFFEDDAQAIPFVQAVRTQLDKLAAIEFFNQESLSLLRMQKKNNTAFAQLPSVDERYGSAVFTEIHCDREEAALERLFAIGAIMAACGGHEEDTWVARNSVDRDRLYFFRHATPESVNMRIDYLKRQDPVITKLGSDMSVPDESLADVMRMYRETLEAEGLDFVIFGHIGNNHLHCNILPRDGEEYRRGKALFRNWAERVTQMGGAVSAEHGVGKLKADFLTIMYGEQHIQEMAKLKAVFDPKGTLGAGNLFCPIKEA